MPVWVRVVRSEGQADPKTLNTLRKCCLKVKTASVPSAKNMLLGVCIW